jgi:hypothetical protein
MVKQCGDYGVLDYDVLNHGLGHRCFHFNQTMFNQEFKIGDQGVVVFYYVVSYLR